MILILPELWQAPYWASLPAHLRFAPEGLGWALHVVPIDPQSARAAQALLIASCGAAILGLGARLAMAGVTVFGLYVFGLSQLSGAVIHDMHLFWFSALLAVSPCGDALSVQRWLRGRLRGQPHAAPPAALVYGVPLQCARVLLGVVYFFPGFWKLEDLRAGTGSSATTCATRSTGSGTSSAPIRRHCAWTSCRGCCSSRRWRWSRSS